MNINRGKNKKVIRGRTGFSLLEIVVAVAILSFSLVAILNLHGSTVTRCGRLEKTTVATFLAQEKMAEYLIELEKDIQKGVFPDDRSESGRFDEPYDNFEWEMALRKVEFPTAPPAGEGDEGGEAANAAMAQMMKMVSEQLADMVREVKLSVHWDEFGVEQGFEVVTHVTKM